MFVEYINESALDFFSQYRQKSLLKPGNSDSPTAVAAISSVFVVFIFVYPVNVAANGAVQSTLKEEPLFLSRFNTVASKSKILEKIKTGLNFKNRFCNTCFNWQRWRRDFMNFK